jgi:hypothetical protein
VGRNEAVLGPIVTNKGQRMGGRADSFHLVGNIAKQKREMHFARVARREAVVNKLAVSLGIRWRRGFGG